MDTTTRINTALERGWEEGYEAARAYFAEYRSWTYSMTENPLDVPPQRPDNPYRTPRA